MTYLLQILCLIGIIWFIRGSYLNSLTILVFFITNGLQLIPEDVSSIKYSDFVLIYSTVVCTYLAFTKKAFFSISDNLSKLLFILLLYVLIELAITVFAGYEEFQFAFKVFRQYIFLGLYFIIRSISPVVLDKLIKRLYVLTTLTLIIYLTQVVLKQKLLTGTVEGIDSYIGDGMNRYRNIPIFFYFFLFYTFLSPSLGKYKWILMLLYLVGLIVPMNRGPIITFVIVFSLYLILQGNLRTYIKYALISVIIGALLWPILSYRFKGGDIGAEVTKSLKSSTYKNFESNGGGTFEFRILLLKERLDYILSNPEYIFTGIGLMHDDSPSTQNKFHFYLGSMKTDNSGRYVLQEIGSDDLVWATLLLRFGLIGIVIYLAIILQLSKTFFINRKSFLMEIGLLLISMYLLNSFATDILIRNSSFFLFFLMYAHAKYIKVIRLNVESIKLPLLATTSN